MNRHARSVVVSLFLFVGLAVTGIAVQVTQDTRRKAVENIEGQEMKWIQVKSEMGLKSLGGNSDSKLQIMVNYSKSSSPILTLGEMKKFNGKAAKNISGDSKIKLLDENQNVIYEGKFVIPNIMMGDKVVELDKTDFAITVPFLENTKNIVIEDKDGKKIVEKSFGDYEIVDNGVDYWTLSMAETKSDDEYIDFVFVGDGYKTEQDLVDYFDPMIDIFSRTIYDIEPFKSRKQQIRIHKIRGNYDLGCSFVYGNACLSCSHSLVEEVVNKANIPNDNVYVLSHNNRLGGCATMGGGIGFGSDSYEKGYEDTDYAGIYKKYGDEEYQKNGNYSNLVAIHEMGHSFASLEDEYIYGDREAIWHISSDNCCETNNSVLECSGWSGNVGKNDVYKGCTSSKIFRTSWDSIMKNKEYSFFNKVSLNLINKKIDSLASLYNFVLNPISMSFSETIGSNNIQAVVFSASSLDSVHHFDLLVDGELDKTYYYTNRGLFWGDWQEKYKQTRFSKTPFMVLDTRSYEDGNRKISIRAMDGLNREIGRVEKDLLIDNSKDLGTKPNLSTKIDKYEQSVNNISISGMSVSNNRLIIPYFEPDRYVKFGSDEDSDISFKLLSGDVEVKSIITKLVDKLATNSAERGIQWTYGIRMPRQTERTGNKIFMSFFRSPLNVYDNKYDLILYKCSDYLCKDMSKNIVESKILGFSTISSLQIEINDQGNPVFAMPYVEILNNPYDYYYNKIKVVICGNDSCSANNTVKILNLDYRLSIIEGIKMFIDKNNNPFFIALRENSNEFIFVSCSDSMCNNYVQTQKLKVDDLGNPLNITFLDAALDKNENPIILYTLQSMGVKELYYVRCIDKMCESNSWRKTIVDKMNLMSKKYSGLIEVDNNNIPVIAFNRYDGIWIKKGQDLALISKGNYEDNNMISDGNFRFALDENNKPMVSYLGTFRKSIEYYHCQTENCKDQVVLQCQDCKINNVNYSGDNRVGGDYNCDGVINGADYVVWRNEFVDKVGTINSDGNCDGKISISDYSRWREMYIK